MITITDGNNYARRLFEMDPTGLAYRQVVREVTTSPHLQVWVWDSFNSNKRRRDLYPEYKLRRNKPGEDMFKSMKLLKDVLKHTRAVQIEVPTYEADDVIATLVHLRSDSIHIRSTDRDFLQLTARDVTTDASPKTGLDAKDTLLFKVCVGDPSDNIPGIKGFGQKAWEAVDKEQLRVLIKMIVDEEHFYNDAELTEKAPSTFTKGQLEWVLNNQSLIRTFHKIVQFYTVPEELILPNITPGTHDPVKVDTILKEFLQ